MYPGPEVLQEVGRVTIAGARLDLSMGHLWHHLDREQPFSETRWKPASTQSKEVSRLTDERLQGALHDEVTQALAAADEARERRNEVVHQDWVLRGYDGLRSVSELDGKTPEQLTAYLEDWERESKDSTEWQRVPSRSTDVVAAQTLDELRSVERALAAASDRLSYLIGAVASSREIGKPPGYVHPR